MPHLELHQNPHHPSRQNARPGKQNDAVPVSYVTFPVPDLDAPGFARTRSTTLANTHVFDRPAHAEFFAANSDGQRHRRVQRS